MSDQRPPTPMITCRELIEILGEYLAGELEPAARAHFDEHLRVCPSCVAYLDGYRRTIALGRQALRASDESADGKVPEGVLSAVRAAIAARNVR